MATAPNHLCQARTATPNHSSHRDLQDLSWPTFGWIMLYQPYPYHYRALSVHNHMVCFRHFHTLPTTGGVRSRIVPVHHRGFPHTPEVSWSRVFMLPRLFSAGLVWKLYFLCFNSICSYLTHNRRTASELEFCMKLKRSIFIGVRLRKIMQPHVMHKLIYRNIPGTSAVDEIFLLSF